MKTIKELRKTIEAEPARSAWKRGVKRYALELVDELEEAIKGGYFSTDKMADKGALKAQLLNGASGWSQYSYGGNALICDYDIAERLCSPSELKKCNGGERSPNRREVWLDVQARALGQAAYMVYNVARREQRERHEYYLIALDGYGQPSGDTQKIYLTDTELKERRAKGDYIVKHLLEADAITQD